jgi:hypothetical protein
VVREEGPGVEGGPASLGQGPERCAERGPILVIGHDLPPASPRSITWCNVPGASSRACRGILLSACLKSEGSVTR